MKKYLFLTLFAAFYSCTHYKSTDYEGSIDEGYPNGIYDAIIQIYNPNTKHNATYTLEVEIENEELIKIYWNMGAGWMIAIFLLLISVKAQLLLLTIEVTDIVSNWISFLEQEFF